MTGPAPVQEPQKLSRRDEIIATAAELFAARSYHAVGMRTIAQAVGIRNSSLYHHFESKDDLLAAIAGEYTHEFIASHLSILEGDDPPDERLRAVIRDQIRYFWDHQLQRMVGLRELGTLAEAKPQLHAEIQSDRRRYQHAIDDVIAEGVEAGIFDVKKLKLASLAVTGIVTSVNDWFNPKGEFTIDEVAEYYAELVVERVLVSG